MKRPLLFLALAAIALVLGTASEARAWGCYHVGYTHVGFGGVQHYGRTIGYSPYGLYSGAHYGSYGAYGAYHTGYAGYTPYMPVYSTGYAVGGYHYGPYEGYRAGVYRGW